MQANDILGFCDLRRKHIKVKQWNNCDLLIQELGLQESMELFSSVKGQDIESGNLAVTAKEIAKIVAYCVIDEDGERIFADKDIPKLARKNRDALMHVYNEIMSLSGSAEDAEKN